MVINKTEHSDKGPAKQGAGEGIGEPNKIGASTPYDFEAKNLTAYGGLLPIATMLEKLGFQQLVEETLTVKRVTRAMSMYQFVLGMVLAVYVGFSRLHHLRFLEREPMLTGILKVLRLPPQCTFWRFLASLHGCIARQLLEVQRRMREILCAALSRRAARGVYMAYIRDPLWVVETRDLENDPIRAGRSGTSPAIRQQLLT
jgi:hypothetical protein